MTSEQMAECAAGGAFWYMRSDGSFYGTAGAVPGNPDDVYLLEASPGWVEQWESWDQAAQVMAPLFDRLQGRLDA